MRDADVHARDVHARLNISAVVLAPDLLESSGKTGGFGSEEILSESERLLL